MQLDTDPPRAADITSDLRKQFAFLSGGRGDNGSPVIVFPEFPAFGEISDKEFHNVLTYLTSVPSLSSTDVGFILVIDRRQDRWAAVKGTLLRIAGSFPGNLQLVLVLRPTTLFQRTLSDILFKFNKDEFKMKVPVIMLSSVTELHAYIDRSQLTQELGGTQQYCHEKWITHRTAIEGFALMVKKTAQTLQLFGTELAETELPNEIQATTILLSTHTKYHVFIIRLLSQLDETERAFDEFWIRHQNKLQQCLQLRRFEQNYREKLTTFSEVGISPAHADHIFSELTAALCHEGEELIQNSHYAEDSIQPKCSELREISESVSSSLKSKKDYLLKALELHYRLERASKWVDDGIYLLASQPVDKCQSHEGAELALLELERYLDNAGANQLTDLGTIWEEYEEVLNQQFKVGKPAPISECSVMPPAGQNDFCLFSPGGSELRRTPSLFIILHVMNELLETERAYVEELLCVLQGYASEMDNASLSHLIPPNLQNKKEVLFGNMPEIYHFHKRTFLRELEQYTDCPELVGRCFLERMTDLQIYEKYCHNKPRSESLWRQCSDCAFFQECQKKLEHKLGLDSYLLKPVQRITKYQLLLKEMLKYSRSCDGAEDLQQALTSILGILKAVNDSMHLIAITGYEGNMSELGKLLMQGSFSVWTEHKKGHAKVKDLARFKPMQRHLFLHEKALLFCKRREENGEGYEKAPSYSFKQSLSMDAVGITENAKGDNKKFEIWCNSREEVYIVQAPTAEVKTTWVNEIRKVLTTQLEACRGTVRLGSG
uniref:MCF.2 cell line derived transforming sequence like n=1 Tax=Nothobranchius furzeri TaxID=105023 RepID=A0A8C6P6N1_NOTFU